MRRDGFTFVEVLVWAAVVSLVAAVGFGLVAPYAEQRKLAAATTRVVAMLEFGRETARHTHRQVSVRVTPDGVEPGANGIRVRYDDDGSDVTDPLTKAGMQLVLGTQSGLGGVRVSLSDADRGATFGPDGEPEDGESRFVLQGGDERVLVRVESPSGRVTTAAVAFVPVEPVPLELPEN